MDKRYHVMVLIIAAMLVLTACSSGGQVMVGMDGEDMVLSYTQISPEEARQLMEQDGYIAIPGSGNPDHIAENYDIFDFELTEDEMDRIRGIDEQRRYEHW